MPGAVPSTEGHSQWQRNKTAAMCPTFPRRGRGLSPWCFQLIAQLVFPAAHWIAPPSPDGSKIQFKEVSSLSSGSVENYRESAALFHPGLRPLRLLSVGASTPAETACPRPPRDPPLLRGAQGWAPSAFIPPTNISERWLCLRPQPWFQGYSRDQNRQKLLLLPSSSRNGQGTKEVINCF